MARANQNKNKFFLTSIQTIFLYWAKLVFIVTRLQLPAGLVIPVIQVSNQLIITLIGLLFDGGAGNQIF